MNPSYYPLILALKDLRIRFYLSQLNSPREFSRTACLLRGDSVLPAADDGVVELHVQSTTAEPPRLLGLPATALKASCRGWPEDTLVAMQGIYFYGPGNDTLANVCACHALRLNRECMLARQLLKLLLEKADLRVPFTDHKTEVADTMAKLGVLPGESARKRWWQFWR